MPWRTDIIRRYESSGLGLRELSRLAGVDPSSLSKYLREERDLGGESVAKIAAALGGALVFKKRTPKKH